MVPGLVGTMNCRGFSYDRAPSTFSCPQPTVPEPQYTVCLPLLQDTVVTVQPFWFPFNKYARLGLQ